MQSRTICGEQKPPEFFRQLDCLPEDLKKKLFRIKIKKDRKSDCIHCFKEKKSTIISERKMLKEDYCLATEYFKLPDMQTSIIDQNKPRNTVNELLTCK